MSKEIIRTDRAPKSLASSPARGRSIQSPAKFAAPAFRNTRDNA